jgi:C-terminal processing protease CtpA/Prc
MKRFFFFFLLLLAGAATAAPPAASSSGELARASDQAAQARDEAERARNEATQARDAAARARDRAARANDEAEREADNARRLADMQKRMNDLAERMAELSVKIGDQASASALSYLADSKRGMLGVVLDDDATGLRVSGLTPGGPAERAKVQDGDVITAMDGVSTRGRDDMFIARHLVVGKPVTLSVLRDGRPLQVRVTPERFQAADWQALARTAQTAAQRSLEKLNSPEFQKQLDLRMELAKKQSEEARAEIAAHWGDNFGANGGWFAPWWGLNLASLNPGLGRYFGTDRGALVLSSDAQRYPGLQAGDVITEVAGRAVSKPEDALRALQALPGNEPARLTVLRHGKPLAVELKTLPRWNLLPPAPPVAPAAPPAPSAPPAPPAAPAAPPAPSAPPAPRAEHSM